MNKLDIVEAACAETEALRKATLALSQGLAMGSWLRDEQLLKHLKEYLYPESQLADITPPEIEGYMVHRRGKVTGSTVNCELTLLKHMFNLAIDWDLYTGSNPLRKVEYFQEINTGFRVLKPDEGTSLLRNATPAIQDIVLYALNTGSRIGEIFSLRLQDVDLDQSMINSFSHKTQKVRIVPINSEMHRILEFWKLGRKNEYVFYNQKTGERFVYEDAGLEQACEKAEIERVTWHTAAHFGLAPFGTRCGHHCGERTIGTFDGHRDDALHAFQSCFEGGIGRQTGWHCYKSATPCT